MHNTLNIYGDGSNALVSGQLKKFRDAYKLTPATLWNKLKPEWIPAPHLMYVSNVVARAIIAGDGRVTVSLPPRHGKTELVTKGTSTWTLEKFPKKEIILCSYGAELSQDFGREVRDIIKEGRAAGLLNTSIRKDVKRVGNWQTPQGGGMRSMGLGGSITGSGADVLLIDDYIKEIKEANSQAQRNYHWDWFTTTAMTRLEPGGTAIVIATRWHHDDLIGRIRKENPGGKWQHVVIPALSIGNETFGRVPHEVRMERKAVKQWPGFKPEEDKDFLGRGYGDPLFEKRYPLEALLEKRDLLGTYHFSALYQQDPKLSQQGITDRQWIEIVPITQLPNFEDTRIFTKPIRVWDFAASANAGDWTAGAKMIRHRPSGTVYIVDMKRARMTPGSVEILVGATAEYDDGKDCTIYLEQEPGASGKQVVDHYRAKVIANFTCESVPATDGKLTRAQPMLAAAERGNIKLVQANWNETFLTEFEAFPSGSKDDQMDVVSIGYVKLIGSNRTGATFGRKRRAVVDSRTLGLAAEIKKVANRGLIFGRTKR